MAAQFVGSYTLVSCNGESSAEAQSVTLQFSAGDNADTLTMHAKVANSLNGAITVKDGEMKGMVMATRMMGSPFEMQVEYILSMGMGDGLKASLAGENLTLSGGEEKVLVFKKN